jgi:hypothetical protein
MDKLPKILIGLVVGTGILLAPLMCACCPLTMICGCCQAHQGAGSSCDSKNPCSMKKGCVCDSKSNSKCEKIADGKITSIEKQKADYVLLKATPHFPVFAFIYLDQSSFLRSNKIYHPKDLFVLRI